MVKVAVEVMVELAGVEDEVVFVIIIDSVVGAVIFDC